MVAKVKSVSFVGIETRPVEIQVQILPGLPSVSIVGLADKAVAESKERVRAAFHSINLSFPQKKLVINLAPADLHKEGSHFDLGIALGIMVEMQLISQSELDKYYVLGELSLDGDLNPVTGILPAAMDANACGYGIICPEDNKEEVVCSGNAIALCPKNLIQLLNHFKSNQIIAPPTLEYNPYMPPKYPDLEDVKGNESAKRALIISAAGGHNLLMLGPPGSGKSMLAKRMPGILPELAKEEMLEVSVIQSIAGIFRDKGMVFSRPFRDPHSSSSQAAMVGGGKNAKPGEISLAHHGVLFLDELPEYNRNVLDALRQPVEDGRVTIARVNNHVTYPAKFQLIAAMNPCKCGYYGNINMCCTKAPKCAEEYQSKISGPMLDRFDIKIEVTPTDVFASNDNERITSAEAKEIVLKARALQRARYQDKGVAVNAHAEGKLLEDAVPLCDKGKELMQSAMLKFNLSMRGYYRVLKVARTIADIEGSLHVNVAHLAESLNYRMIKVK